VKPAPVIKIASPSSYDKAMLYVRINMEYLLGRLKLMSDHGAALTND
jgi:hypothetical protein